MASRFHALSVPGEAFLLRTDQDGRNWAVLVDTGNPTKAAGADNPILKAIRAVEPDLRTIDVVVCTHEDSDHAGGLPTFLEAWTGAGNVVDELWLPAGWSRALPTALIDPIGLVQGLAQGVSDLPLDDGEGHPGGYAPMGRRAGATAPPEAVLDIQLRLSRAATQIKFAESATASDLPLHGASTTVTDDGTDLRMRSVLAALGLTPELEFELERIEDETDLSSKSLREIASHQPIGNLLSDPDIAVTMRVDALEPLRRHVLDLTIGTADAVRSIARQALRQRIRVRWFDFDLFERHASATGGLPGLLLPVNAVETSKAPAERDMRFLALSLTLTRQNVGSLVFLRPETDSEPSVLFLADSRLAFGISSPTNSFPKPDALDNRRPTLVTAAHHGSRVNDRAYAVLSTWLGAGREELPIFVRNGGQTGQTLGTYANVAKERRRCAQCFQCAGIGSRTVTVAASAADWIWPPKTPACGDPRPA